MIHVISFSSAIHTTPCVLCVGPGQDPRCAQVCVPGVPQLLPGPWSHGRGLQRVQEPVLLQNWSVKHRTMYRSKHMWV